MKIFFLPLFKMWKVKMLSIAIAYYIASASACLYLMFINAGHQVVSTTITVWMPVEKFRTEKLSKWRYFRNLKRCKLQKCNLLSILILFSIFKSIHMQSQATEIRLFCFRITSFYHLERVFCIHLKSMCCIDTSHEAHSWIKLLSAWFTFNNA